MTQSFKQRMMKGEKSSSWKFDDGASKGVKRVGREREREEKRRKNVMKCHGKNVKSEICKLRMEGRESWIKRERERVFNE